MSQAAQHPEDGNEFVETDSHLLIPRLKRRLSDNELQFLRLLADGPPDETPDWHVRRATAQLQHGLEKQPTLDEIGYRPTMDPTRPRSAITVDAAVLSAVIRNATSEEKLVRLASGERFRIHHAGLYAATTTFVGPLDLTGASFAHPIRFVDCTFTGGVTLDSAHLGHRTAFEDCHLSALYGNAIHVDGDLDFLRSCVDGIVDLRGARIGGMLLLKQSRFNELELAEKAFDANNARIAEDVMAKDIVANGEVCLRNIVIEGHLDCSGATFQNPANHALVCDAARIGGDILLTDGFKAFGKVSLLRIAVRGIVRCEGGTFVAPTAPKESVLALDLQWARIDGNLYLCNVEKLHGGVDLRDARVTGLADDQTAWPKPPFELRLDGFVYDVFVDAPLANEAKEGRTDCAWKTRLEWLRHQNKDDVTSRLKPQPFVQLANVLHSMGYYADARKILEKREDIWFWCVRPRGLFEWLDKWCFRLPLMVLAGHGYQALRAAALLFGLWAAGALVFQDEYDNGLIVPTNTARSDVTPSEITFKSGMLSLDVIVPVAEFHEEEKWVFNGWASWCRWIFTLSGWLLSFIALAGFAGLVQRDRLSDSH